MRHGEGELAGAGAWLASGMSTRGAGQRTWSGGSRDSPCYPLLINMKGTRTRTWATRIHCNKLGGRNERTSSRTAESSWEGQLANVRRCAGVCRRPGNVEMDTTRR